MKESTIEADSDLRYLMQDHFLRYASYVILDRAIPNIVDGLKPVQRRILHTLFRIHDGKLHKVANAAGQAMAFHPHGDAPITDALVNLANKGYLLDRQGNFGNIYTGDPAAASRYIETRLSQLAIETMFNPDITETIPSYDGRNQEPVCLPAKIPVLLMQGAEGIAVGMSTRILPHNFVELLEAEIAILEGKPFEVYPDFYTGGLMDVSQYEQGNGKVKLRAKIDIVDQKTLVIREICYGTTTESLTRSIDDAAKKGKIKIDSINDYTADQVEIEIKLPRGQYAKDLIKSLYAFTDCEVSLSSQITVIKGDRPVETNVNDVLKDHAERLKGYLKRELEIERDRLKEKIFDKTLEQIFIENRLYKPIETIGSYEKIHECIEKGLKPFHKKLSRKPAHEDRERLLNIPIRRISKFDIQKNQDDIKALIKKLANVEKDLKQVKKVTVRYLKALIKTYGKEFERLTEIRSIKEIDKKAIATKQVKVGVDLETGFIGTRVKSAHSFECTNFDKILVLSEDGTYRVMNIPEKEYVKNPVFAGVADKKTVVNVIYQDPKKGIPYSKRFIVKKFILDKVYRYFDEGMKLLYLTTAANQTLELRLKPKAKQKVKKLVFDFESTLIKGVSAKGVKIYNNAVKKVVPKDEGEPSDDPQLDLFSLTS